MCCSGMALGNSICAEGLYHENGVFPAKVVKKIECSACAVQPPPPPPFHGPGDHCDIPFQVDYFPALLSQRKRALELSFGIPTALLQEIRGWGVI